MRAYLVMLPDAVPLRLLPGMVAVQIVLPKHEDAETSEAKIRWATQDLIRWWKERNPQEELRA